MALFDTIRAGASGAADDYEIQNSLKSVASRSTLGSPSYKDVRINTFAFL